MMKLIERMPGMFDLEATGAEAAEFANDLLKAYGACGNHKGAPYASIALVTGSEERGPGQITESDLLKEGYVSCDGEVCASIFPHWNTGLAINLNGRPEQKSRITSEVMKLLERKMEFSMEPYSKGVEVHGLQ